MPLQPHADRRRAESFGVAADDYDRYRPRYPQSLIAGLITRDGMRVLDVGAGTGIASAQLRDAGAQVLAVEPDVRMVRVAAAKGIPVEQATFEDWQATGAPFDLIAFAQSFHWMQPERTMDKIAAILTPHGRVALLANRIIPIVPTQRDMDEINADYLDVAARSMVNAEEEVAAMFEQHGFAVEQRRVVERLHYSTVDYLHLVFTYSNHLTLPPAGRAELWSRLEERIGTSGVDVENHALAVVCTRHTLD